MTKKKSPIASSKVGDAVRVLDAGTRDEITHVITADAEAGKVTRYAVEDGNLVREGDAFRIIEEERAVLIEPAEPVAVDPLDVSAIESEGEAQA